MHDDDPERPAAEIPLRLLRQILLVPFGIQPADDRTASWSPAHARTRARARMEHDPQRRWRRLEEPLFHLEEDELSDDLPTELRARHLAAAYEEFVYFEPYVRDFLFGREGQEAALEIWRSTRLAAVEVELSPAGTAPAAGAAQPPPATFRFAVDRANLYLFPTGNALLALELRLKFQRRGREIVATHLADGLSLLESVRRMFPPYFKRRGGGHAVDAPLEAGSCVHRLRLLDHAGTPLGEADTALDQEQTIETVVGRAGTRARKAVPLMEPWRRLLEPLNLRGLDAGATAPAGDVVLDQLGDDRAFVLAQVGVDDTHAVTRADWVRLCFLDAPGGGLPYSASFLHDFEQRHCYDRFFSPTRHGWLTTRYLVCNYAVVAVGATPPAHRPEAGRCFFRHVLGKHLRRQYFQLVLIAMLQKTALKTLSDRITKIDYESSHGVAEVQREVLTFTHRYWFEDLSSQHQAHELFDLLRRHLRLRELYAQISQESREAHALATQAEQGRLARSANSLNVIAGVGLALSVIVGFFGMNVFDAAWFAALTPMFFTGVLLTSAGGFALLFVARETLIDRINTDRVVRTLFFATIYGALAAGIVLLTAALT